MAEGTSDMVEVPSDQNSGSDPDDNFAWSRVSRQPHAESLQSDSPFAISLLDRLRSSTPADYLELSVIQPCSLDSLICA